MCHSLVSYHTTLHGLNKKVRHNSIVVKIDIGGEGSNPINDREKLSSVEVKGALYKTVHCYFHMDATNAIAVL